jgi:transcriptional regulator with GAF, ATPase, and Fis domain
LCQSIIARIKRWQEVETYVHNDQIQRLLVGQSPAWHKLLRNVVELALFTNGPILIQGESGTGKELIAQIIHQVDQRKDKQSLVLVDCTTLQATLSGSELFGHERGAFTDASNSREGAVSLADKGSLFLDELGELPLNIQAQFLRLLQEGTYKKVGSNQWKRSKFRLISATNRDLETEVDNGTFRMDLYYRVCANIIKVPNLKSRIEDIPVLVRHFISSALKMAKMPHIDSYLMNYLMTRSYKGNIRELKHLCQQLAHRYPGEGSISLAHLPRTEFQTNQEQKHFWERIGFINCLRQAIADGIGLKDIKRIAANVAMDLAIKDSDGNLQQAAQVLDISDRKLQAYQASKRKEEPPSNVA